MAGNLLQRSGGSVGSGDLQRTVGLECAGSGPYRVHGRGAQPLACASPHSSAPAPAASPSRFASADAALGGVPHDRLPPRKYLLLLPLLAACALLYASFYAALHFDVRPRGDVPTPSLPAAPAAFPRHVDWRLEGRAAPLAGGLPGSRAPPPGGGVAHDPLYRAVFVVKPEDRPVALEESLFLEQEDFGVVHVQIPHLLFSEDERKAADPVRDSGAGVLHLWLKALLPPSARPDDGVVGVEIRGFMFFESAVNPLNSLDISAHHYRMPNGLFSWQPTISLHAVDGNGRVESQGSPMALHYANAPDRPWGVLGTLPHAAATFQVRVAGWPRRAVFAPRYARRAPPGAPPAFHFAVVPYTKVEPRIPARFLAHHVSYHTALGFSGWLYYVKAQYMPGHGLQRELRRLAADGTVMMLRWRLPLHFNPALYWHPEQALNYNHAILAYAGRNTYLSLVDLDEFLLLPPHIPSVSAAAAACFAPPRGDDDDGGGGGGARRFGIASLPRHDVHCSSCAAGEPELRYWMEAPPYSGGVPHPLARYDQRGHVYGRMHSKAIVDPDKVFRWHVHEGMLWPGEDPRLLVDVDAGCASWAHITNMFMRRDLFHENLTTDTSWWWVFDALRGGQGGQGVGEAEGAAQLLSAAGGAERKDERAAGVGTGGKDDWEEYYV